MENLKKFRNFMKSPFSTEDDNEDYELSDQQKKLPQPPLEKPYNESDKIIDLPEVTYEVLIKSNILDLIRTSYVTSGKSIILSLSL